MNKKGFVLAEAIVVSVFVIGMVAYIAVNMLPLISRYEKASNYDDLQEVYLVNDLYDEIKVRNITLTSGVVYKYTMRQNDYSVDCIPGTGVLCTAQGIKEYIYKYLNISEIVIGNVQKTELSRSMREYYNYYKINNKVTDIPDNVMLVKFQDNTFASIVMK